MRNVQSNNDTIGKKTIEKHKTENRGSWGNVSFKSSWNVIKRTVLSGFRIWFRLRECHSRNSG